MSLPWGGIRSFLTENKKNIRERLQFFFWNLCHCVARVLNLGKGYFLKKVSWVKGSFSTKSPSSSFFIRSRAVNSFLPPPSLSLSCKRTLLLFCIAVPESGKGKKSLWGAIKTAAKRKKLHFVLQPPLFYCSAPLHPRGDTYSHFPEQK